MLDRGVAPPSPTNAHTENNLHENAVRFKTVGCTAELPSCKFAKDAAQHLAFSESPNMKWMHSDSAYEGHGFQNGDFDNVAQTPSVCHPSYHHFPNPHRQMYESYPQPQQQMDGDRTLREELLSFLEDRKGRCYETLSNVFMHHRMKLRENRCHCSSRS